MKYFRTLLLFLLLFPICEAQALNCRHPGKAAKKTQNLGVKKATYNLGPQGFFPTHPVLVKSQSGVVLPSQLPKNLSPSSEGVTLNLPRNIDPKVFDEISIVDLAWMIKNQATLPGRLAFSVRANAVVEILSSRLEVDAEKSEYLWVELKALKHLGENQSVGGVSTVRMGKDDILFLVDGTHSSDKKSIPESLQVLIAEALRSHQSIAVMALIRGLSILDQLILTNPILKNHIESVLGNHFAKRGTGKLVLQSLKRDLEFQLEGRKNFSEQEALDMQTVLILLNNEFGLDLVRLGLVIKLMNGNYYFWSEIKDNSKDPLVKGKYNIDFIQYFEVWLWQSGINHFLPAESSQQLKFSNTNYQNQTQSNRVVVPISIGGSEGKQNLVIDQQPVDKNLLAELLGVDQRLLTTETTAKMVLNTLLPPQFFPSAISSGSQNPLALIRSWALSKSIRTQIDQAKISVETGNTVLFLSTPANQYNELTALILRIRMWSRGYADFVWYIQP